MKEKLIGLVGKAKSGLTSDGAKDFYRTAGALTVATVAGVALQAVLTGLGNVVGRLISKNSGQDDSTSSESEE